MDRSYEELKNAVVVQAVKDYRFCRKRKPELEKLMESEKNPDEYDEILLEYRKICAMIRDVERFLTSPYGTWFLGEISGEWLLDQLRKE